MAVQGILKLDSPCVFIHLLVCLFHSKLRIPQACLLDGGAHPIGFIVVNFHKSFLPRNIVFLTGHNFQHKLAIQCENIEFHWLCPVMGVCLLSLL